MSPIDIALTILFAWLLADLITGAFHWFEDQYIDADSPYGLGKFVGAPNDLHHDKPRAMLENGYWSRNGVSMLLALVFVITPGILIGSPLLILTGIFGSHANQFHAWTHMGRDAPAWVRKLQGPGLLQTSRQHAIHHRYFLDNYCVMTDLVNPIVDRIGFWRALERLISMATRGTILPKHV